MVLKKYFQKFNWYEIARDHKQQRFEKIFAWQFLKFFKINSSKFSYIVVYHVTIDVYNDDSIFNINQLWIAYCAPLPLLMAELKLLELQNFKPCCCMMNVISNNCVFICAILLWLLLYWVKDQWLSWLNIEFAGACRHWAIQ